MSKKSNPVFNLEMFLPNYQEITERARKALVRTDVAAEVLTALKDVLAYEDDLLRWRDIGRDDDGVEVYERAYKAIQNAEGER
jgi:hypothetical protein